MLPAALLVLTVALTLGACDKAQEERRRVAAEYQKRLPEMVKRRIIAGPTEKTFEENQGVNVHLPIREEEFIALLKRLNLDYDDQGDTVIPQPHWKPDAINEFQIQHTYQIYGKIDREHQFREIYRAWIDKNGQVVYIENMFGYFGAP